jgi:paraquat-inducible protein A
MTGIHRAQHLGVIGCRVCGLVVAPTGHESDQRCPRCRSVLHSRHARSIERTWALLFASMICYMPANLLPVMEISSLGHAAHPSTVIGGVTDLWRDGSYDVALVILATSVVIPCAKFFVLAFLLMSVQFGWSWAQRTRSRLFHLLELVGYWSMLDVLVVGLLACLVKFDALGGIEPGPGIFFFGISVVLTMLAAHSFDPRLIWDSEKGEA